MPDAVVDGVVFHLHRLHVASSVGGERAFVGLLDWCQGVGEVNHVACLAFLEEGGVSRTVDLLHLPLHWREHHLVFPGVWVRPYPHRPAVGVDHRSVVECLVVPLVIIHRVGLFFQWVGDVIDQS